MPYTYIHSFAQQDFMTAHLKNPNIAAAAAAAAALL